MIRENRKVSSFAVTFVLFVSQAALVLAATWNVRQDSNVVLLPIKMIADARLSAPTTSISVELI